MEKRITFYEFQSVKRVAQACDPIIRQRNRIKAQIEKLVEQYKGYDMQIKSLEEGVTKVLGLRVEDMVKKVIEPDSKGNKTTKYLPTDKVKYDAATKQYIISTDDPQIPDASEIPDNKDEEKKEEENKQEEVNREVENREPNEQPAVETPTVTPEDQDATPTDSFPF